MRISGRDYFCYAVDFEYAKKNHISCPSVPYTQSRDIHWKEVRQIFALSLFAYFHCDLSKNSFAPSSASLSVFVSLYRQAYLKVFCSYI